MVKPILEMKNITKRFPGVVANNKVNLTLYPGEVHALLGENGAGKSTLMNVLTGIYAPNEGELFFKGEKIELKSPKTAVDLGIGMVHQHFKLIEPLTVAENIYMPSKNCKFMLNLKEMNDRITELSKQFNLPVFFLLQLFDLFSNRHSYTLSRMKSIRLCFCRDAHYNT